MYEPQVSNIYLDDEESLSIHCSLWGVDPSMISVTGDSVHLNKTIYNVGRIQISAANVVSGWCFKGPLGTDAYYISNTSIGQSIWEVSGHGRVSSPDQVCVVDSSSLVAAQFACGTIMETVVIEADFLHQQLASLQGFPCLQRLQFEPLSDGPYGSTTWSIINSLLQSIKICVDQGFSEKSPLTLSYLKQALIIIILERLPHNYQLSGNRQQTCILPSHINKAINYINAHAHRDIMLSDIADYACTSIRNLQIGFKRFKNTTPLKYLRLVRLSLAHASINNPTGPSNWQQVALSLGFSDLYLFSKHYKSVYGHSPAQHQRRVRGF